MPMPQCPNCSQNIILNEETYKDYVGSVTCPSCRERMAVEFSQGRLLNSTPLIPSEFIIGDQHTIPDAPLADYQEALTCFIYHAFKASAVMQRRVIQGALLAKGIQEGAPMIMINRAANMGIIKAREQHLATTVTYFGGKGAHPEEKDIGTVRYIEANTGLLVTKELLLTLFPLQ